MTVTHLGSRCLATAIMLRRSFSGNGLGMVPTLQRGRSLTVKSQLMPTVTTLKNNGLTGSMGRVGACVDNSAMESFFALMQRNVLDRQR